MVVPSWVPPFGRPRDQPENLSRGKIDPADVTQSAPCSDWTREAMQNPSRFRQAYLVCVGGGLEACLLQQGNPRSSPTLPSPTSCSKNAAKYVCFGVSTVPVPHGVCPEDNEAS